MSSVAPHGSRPLCCSGERGSSATHLPVLHTPCPGEATLPGKVSTPSGLTSTGSQAGGCATQGAFEERAPTGQTAQGPQHGTQRRKEKEGELVDSET